MAQIQHVVTAGQFSLGGQTFDVENNIWIVGDDEDVVVIDAAHDAPPILDGIGGRTVCCILCTHGHNDHINAAIDLAEAVDAPVALHAADRMLWDAVHPDRPPDLDLDDGHVVRIAGAVLRVLHTPGHSPGSVSLYDEAGSVVFGGDTLFKGGPGATGIPYADSDTILASIRNRLLVLPHATVVHTGHGESTTIGDEAHALQP
jgi:glyoxylase-like metal-dependent hydrolase (beta-lactamase superfamily II)